MAAEKSVEWKFAKAINWINIITASFCSSHILFLAELSPVLNSICSLKEFVIHEAKLLKQRILFLHSLGKTCFFSQSQCLIKTRAMSDSIWLFSLWVSDKIAAVDVKIELCHQRPQVGNSIKFSRYGNVGCFWELLTQAIFSWFTTDWSLAWNNLLSFRNLLKNLSRSRSIKIIDYGQRNSSAKPQPQACACFCHIPSVLLACVLKQDGWDFITSFNVHLQPHKRRTFVLLLIFALWRERRQVVPEGLQVVASLHSLEKARRPEQSKRFKPR